MLTQCAVHSQNAISTTGAWKEAYMRKFIFEPSILVQKGDMSIDRIYGSLMELCTSINRSGTDLHLNFEVGSALLRVACNAFLMRVEADDLVGCHSMKVVLEGTAVEIAGLKQSSILWIAANSVPFAALADHPIVPRI